MIFGDGNCVTKKNSFGSSENIAEAFICKESNISIFKACRVWKVSLRHRLIHVHADFNNFFLAHDISAGRNPQIWGSLSTHLSLTLTPK